MPASTQKSQIPKSLTNSISVAQAKANLSSVLSGVEKGKRPVTILRRGIPVAQIIPFEKPAVAFIGSMRGTVRELGDIVGPTGVEWTARDDG